MQRVATCVQQDDMQTDLSQVELSECTATYAHKINNPPFSIRSCSLQSVWNIPKLYSCFNKQFQVGKKGWYHKVINVLQDMSV